jgi:hypothetical protein
MLSGAERVKISHQKEKPMKIRMSYVLSLVCLSTIVVLAQAAGLEGNWVTDGVPAVEAAKKAGKSLTGVAEGTKIKFKVDAKKGKVSGTITQLNTDKEYDIEDGKITEKTFTFKSVEVVPIGNSGGGFGGRGGGGGNTPPAPPPAISWKGELTDANTVTLTRLDAKGEPLSNSTLVLHRAGK